MTAKNIERLLEQTFLHDGAMQYGLYEYELEELLDKLTSSPKKPIEKPLRSVPYFLTNHSW